MTYIDRADEKLRSRHEVCHCYTQKHSEEPCSEKSFPSLLGRDLDQGCSPKGDTAEVGEDVVGHNQGDWHEEPNVTFENIVDDEMGLSNDQEQGHVRPGELAELELVMALLQRRYEEDEAYQVSRGCCGLTGRFYIPIMYSMKEMNLWCVASGSRMRSTSRMCLK